MSKPSMMEFGDGAKKSLEEWQRKQRWEIAGIVALVIVFLVLIVFAVGGIFAAIGYPIILAFGAKYTFWGSAAAGFGTLVLAFVLFAGVGHVLSSARRKSNA